MSPEQPAQLTRDNMAAANKLSTSSTSLLPRARSIAPRGEAVWGTTWGLRHHGLTSIIVPEIDHWSRVVDLTCNGSSQTSRDGANSPIPLRAAQNAPG